MSAKQEAQFRKDGRRQMQLDAVQRKEVRSSIVQMSKLRGVIIMGANNLPTLKY